MNIQEIQKTYQSLNSGCDQLLGRYQAHYQHTQAVKAEVGNLERELSILTFSSAALEQLLNSVSVESLEKVEQLVSYGLRVVFEDQNLSFKIEVMNKRGAQWFEPKLIHGSIEAPILDAFGGGPAAICGFLLRVLVCRRLGLAPLLLLDEPFSFVSAEYVPNVSKLLRELSDQLGMTFILVSHQADVGAVKHANHVYEAIETSGGTILKPVKTVG